ncbi:hypothetical protein S7711_03554 [Stachybotrys chartarum IBT 7711]|uniref:Mob1/phocein family protein n=1 Tax=Stachybotrys chartarum (strain CBS 109288 / IBT 7711) TaxID=1280523 RepID=A0A084B1Q9_STACB|nr:hypothetical protein S7711_03554 [Stachybotrys chartarum IBT 7711]KFA51719.1 hypothetical protein S40293_02788 [Stachybotrys chartarum IBT 40293]
MSLAPSSPRLPSPPPPAEIQIGPNSPSGGPAATLQASQMEQSQLDASSRRRIHPGTKAAEMAAGPPLVPLNEVCPALPLTGNVPLADSGYHQLDSAFQLQEHLAALHHHHTASNCRPLTRSTALQLAESPNGVDRTIWLYELCRFLISQCNSLIVGFLFDSPPCSANTCPEMRASEWQFLCAVHEQPKSCCAIDYCCHTLDWAANIVTDQKIFPSRFVVLNDTQSKNHGVKNLVNVFRRLHRIFAHAWFQHRSVFWSVEGQTGLYVLFKTVCDLYDLLPAENYKLPPEAEGLEAPVSEPEPERPPPTILKPPSQQRGPEGEGDNFSHVGRTNTRRHIRSSPSTGSAVTTVIETDEEDGDRVARKMKDLHITAPETVEEEPEVAEVPVIVEGSMMSDSASEPKPSESGTGDDDADGASDINTTVVEVDPEDAAYEEHATKAESHDDGADPKALEKANPTTGDDEAETKSTSPGAPAETAAEDTADTTTNQTQEAQTEATADSPEGKQATEAKES